MIQTLVFDPLLPWAAIAFLATLASLAVIVALWRGLPGWALRGAAALVLLAALAQPSLQQEEARPLSDIVLILEDQTASQRLANRAESSLEAANALAARLQARPNTEVRRIPIADGAGDEGSLLMTAVADALAQEPPGRIAGIFLMSDGRLHDLENTPSLPAPLHLMLSGEETDWDRRLIVQKAPAFAILGEPITLSLRIEDKGAAPGDTETDILISVDGSEPQSYRVPIGQDLDLPVTLDHGGLNVLQFTVPEAKGELTDRNNTALIQINGVRDRLRVLLVSGEPHAGGRTWRNLLKSDSSVDLVHFTILRPPEKQDGVPRDELSLIAFPTRELFMEKVDDFDLIIFDRYKRRSILPSTYLDNVRRYIEEGGAVLFAAGPDFASGSSLYESPLKSVVPAVPTKHVIQRSFLPKVTDLGQRHPVTADLETDGDWGQWLRQIELTPQSGNVVMSGAEDKPLLILDRVGEGRVALLASDQAWLWGRGYDGGGPQLELLRRLAHWLMKEPELEEEALWAEPSGQSMRIIRRTLKEDIGAVTVIHPDGTEEQIALTEVSPGRFEATFDGPEIGLYRLVEGEATAVVGLGPAAPREYEDPIANGAELGPLISTWRGGVLRMSDGVPLIRAVSAGRPAAGRNWLGITPRGASETMSMTQMPLLPVWLVLILVGFFSVGAWLMEGRK